MQVLIGVLAETSNDSAIQISSAGNIKGADIDVINNISSLPDSTGKFTAESDTNETPFSM